MKKKRNNSYWNILLRSVMVFCIIYPLVEIIYYFSKNVKHILFFSVHLHHSTVVTKHNYYFIEGFLYFLSWYSLHFYICKQQQQHFSFCSFFLVGANAFSYVGLYSLSLLHSSLRQFTSGGFPPGQVILCDSSGMFYNLTLTLVIASNPTG